VTTKREEIAAMTRLLTEPARGRAVAELEALDAGRGTLFLADYVRAGRVPKKLAVLIALEAAEWKLAGSLKTGVPGVWSEWFRLETFPARAIAVARLLPVDGGRAFALQVTNATDGGDWAETGLSEAVTVVARELAARLGSDVRVCEV